MTEPKKEVLSTTQGKIVKNNKSKYGLLSKTFTVFSAIKNNEEIEILTIKETDPKTGEVEVYVEIRLLKEKNNNAKL